MILFLDAWLPSASSGWYRRWDAAKTPPLRSTSARSRILFIGIRYFGLTVQLPKEWIILDQDARQRSRQKGVAVLAGNDSAFAKQLKAADMQSLSLFTAYKKPPGSPPPNPSILGVAERVSREVTGSWDYLAGARDLLKAGQMTVRFPKEIYMRKISGAEFAVLEVEILIDGKKARQKQYCTFAKGYALGFVISFTTDQDEALLTGVMESVRFDLTAASKRSSGTTAPTR